MSQGENNVVFCNFATFCKCDLKMMLDLLMVVDKRNKNVYRENIWKPFLKTNVTQIFRLFVRFCYFYHSHDLNSILFEIPMFAQARFA